MLYTGVHHIDHHRADTVDAQVQEAVAAALEVQPNSAFLGSAYRMSLMPLGLWVYNGLYTDRDKGFRHWLWQHFKSDPTLVSQVNPRLRAQAAVASLRDEGYFYSTVDYDTIYHPTDSLRARIAYDVTYRHQSRLGQITWMPSRSARVDSIVQHTRHLSQLHTGDRFSSSSLEAERQRIVKTLHDSGYFFFSSDHIRFVGDTLRQPSTVDLRILIGVGADVRALSPCTIDSVHYRLDHGVGLRSQNHDTLGFMTIGYNGPRTIKPRYLRRSLGFRRHALYSPDRIQLAKTLIGRLNVFKYSTTEFELLRPAASLTDTTSLRLGIAATYAMPWSGTTEVGCVYKDNDHFGPSATLSATRRNLWGGGEQLAFQLSGSYEWFVGRTLSSESLNSYELGAKTSITVPRLQLPHMFHPSREKPISSVYSVSLDWTRRGGLFEMIRASAGVEYNFSLDEVNTLTFSPLRLSYVSLMRKSDGFEVMMEQYPSLDHSFEDQFIPQLQVGWTYDNASRKVGHRTRQYFSVTLSEAGGLTDLAMGQWGSHRKQGERQLFFQRFSQFLKATAEFRNLHRLTSRLTLASRLQGGIGYAYGNSDRMPYSEQFFIGGPNSLRGFSVRGIGPGSCTFYSYGNYAYNYLNRVGDLKLEGNVELRFPLVGSLHGALFADAGNVWRLRSSATSQMGTVEGVLPTDGEQLDARFLKQLAVDAGAGLRLDLGMLVLRFDVGVPLHNPNSLNTQYFNCTHRLLHNLGYNLAVGYPF